MLSPYALTRPGGVQGQVVGLARSLRALGHQVTVLSPSTRAQRCPTRVGDHIDIGRPTALHSNGSVAPVAFWPTTVARAERAVRTGGFDVLHVHEPLAPMAAYGLVLTAPLPMVGTYHRAGVSRWVPVLKPLAELVGRRMQIRVAVSEAARETGERSSGGEFEVLFNGVDMERFESADPIRDEQGRPTVLFLGRHEERKGLGVLLDAFAMVERPAVLWISGDGPASEVQHRRHPESDRVHWLGTVSDDEVASRLAGADVLCAPRCGRVVRHGAARGHGGRLRGRGLGHRGVPGRRGRSCHVGASGRRRGAGPRAGRGAGRRRRGQRPVLARGSQGAASSTHGPGRWTPWPSATSTSTSAPSRPTGRRSPARQAQRIEPSHGGLASRGHDRLVS